MHTVYFCDSIHEDFLLGLFVRKALKYRINYCFSELSLLALLSLLFETNPAVQDSLKFRGQSDALTLNESIRFEFCGLLGKGEETLSNCSNILHLSNGVNASLDSLSMLSTSTIENTLDLGNVPLGPLLVWLTDNLSRNIFRD